jgi:hypothetical protein
MVPIHVMDNEDISVTFMGKKWYTLTANTKKRNMCVIVTQRLVSQVRAFTGDHGIANTGEFLMGTGG